MVASTLLLVIRALLLFAEHADAAGLRDSRSTYVETKNGRIRGNVKQVLSKDVATYFGVPFAKPPVGKLRFKSPEPLDSWAGTLDTVTLARACPQERDETFPGFQGSEMWNANTPVDEDCLYMNIWAPLLQHRHNTQNLSVLVWLFGGGFWYGSPSLDIYNAEGLAAEGNVIVINIAYRVAAFGFLYLDHPDVPGNMGLLDQQMALRWIQDNIAVFGGDPRRVTLFGESAGAAAAVSHMIAPASQNLFARAILESGAITNPWAMDPEERALNKSWQFVDAVGCRRPSMRATVACLVAAPVTNISKEIFAYYHKLHFMEFPLVPVSRDRNFFTVDAYRALREGKFKPVDLIVGMNADEGTFWIVYYLPHYFVKTERNDPAPTLSYENFSDCLRRTLDRENFVVQQAAEKVYLDGAHKCAPSDGSPQKPLSAVYTDLVNQMVGDYQFTCDMLWTANQTVVNGVQLRTPPKVYAYSFEHPSSSNPWPLWMGTMHGYEIEYVFGIPLLQHSPSPGASNKRNGGSASDGHVYLEKERKLSKEMVKYWASFADTGVPDSGDRTSVRWPQYDLQSRKYLVIKADKKEVKTKLKDAECHFWTAVRDLEHHKSKVSSSSTIVSSTVTATTLPLLFLFLL